MSRSLRIFAGFFVAAVTGIALGVLMGMSRHRLAQVADHLDRGALSAAEDLAHPAADHLARHRRGLHASSSAPSPRSSRS